MKQNLWQKYYDEIPLEQIPWQRNENDWFNEILLEGKIKGKTAIDLGCGTGIKTIALAENNFDKVIGVDLSTEAIKYANKNLKVKKLMQKVKFLVGDVTEVSSLVSETFDFILDWSTFHTIPKKKITKYLNEFIKISHTNSVILLRCFSKEGTKDTDHFEFDLLGIKANIYLYSPEDIKKLFEPDFKIIEYKTGTKSKGPTSHLFLNEYLLKRISNGR